MLCCVIFSSCSSKEKVLGLGENIHHDDFEYSVQRVEKAAQIGTLRTQGTFLIVTFQVENRARRVDHRWSNDIASTGHPASYIAGKYAAWKAVDPDMPVWVNFSGGYVIRPDAEKRFAA